MNDRCLTDTELLDFAQGRAGEDDAIRWREHLDACATCQELLALSTSAAAPRSGRLSGLPSFLETNHLERFILLSEIGRGAMGTVLLASDPRLHRQVAIKVLHATDPEAQARLEQEAQALAKLSHPNIVTVFDVGQFQGRIYMAMEYIDGSSLRAWLAAGAQTEREIVEVFVQAGEGLAAAHRAGVIHRDFKPDNVLVGRDGRVRVLDFGLARDNVEREWEGDPEGFANGQTVLVTRTGLVVGTPAYMAPEQYAAAPLSPATDQFAFAVALSEALYGERPFAGDTLEAVRENVVHARLRMPPRARGSVYWPAILRALAHDPSRRFGAMFEFLNAIREASKPKSSRAKLAIALSAGILALGGVVASLRGRGPSQVGPGRSELPSPASASAALSAPPVDVIPKSEVVRTDAAASSALPASVTSEHARREKPRRTPLPRPSSTPASTPVTGANGAPVIP